MSGKTCQWSNDLLQLEQNKEWTIDFDSKMIFIGPAKCPSNINLFFFLFFPMVICAFNTKQWIGMKFCYLTLEKRILKCNLHRPVNPIRNSAFLKL